MAKSGIVSNFCVLTGQSRTTNEMRWLRRMTVYEQTCGTEAGSWG